MKAQFLNQVKGNLCIAAAPGCGNLFSYTLFSKIAQCVAHTLFLQSLALFSFTKNKPSKHHIYPALPRFYAFSLQSIQTQLFFVFPDFCKDYNHFCLFPIEIRFCYFHHFLVRTDFCHCWALRIRTPIWISSRMQPICELRTMASLQWISSR